MKIHPSLSLLAAATVIIAFPSPSYGHGGGLNAYGCHNETATGTYHCHNGPLDGNEYASEQDMINAYNEATGNNPDPINPATGIPDYNRSDYMSSWRDNDSNCIDTRHEVLARESLVTPTFDEAGCHVIAGEWYDPYSGEYFYDPSDLDIDHMVPLQEAHISGAYAWDANQKSDYANELLIADALIAVSASENRSKGARDPADWLPRHTLYHCEYAHDWVTIKTRFGLEYGLIELYTIEQILGGPIEHTAMRESHGWDAADQTESSAIFGYGMRKLSRCGYTAKALPTDSIEVKVSMQPNPEHINQNADLYLAAEMNGALFSITPAGAFIPWNGDVSTLVPMIDDFYLRQSIDMTVFQGVLNAELSFNLFIGYGTESGDFVYTPQPFQFVVAQ